MRIFKSGDICGFSSVVMLGMFDGLHRGHMVLAEKAVEEAEKTGAKALMYTFSSNPKTEKKMLMDERGKISRSESLGLYGIYFDEFTEQFRKMSPRDFIENIIVKRLNAKAVVVGESYRYGYMHSGTPEDLLGYGFDVFVLPEYKVGDITVSSSCIRELIEKGDAELASALLGYNYTLSGVVVKGRKVGRELGTKTANLKISDSFVCPGSGVYATYVWAEGKRYPSVTNIGTCPTFNLKCKTFETHILGFEEDIYGSEISVEFVKYLRDEAKFDSPDLLIKQISQDVSMAKQILNGD